MGAGFSLFHSINSNAITFICKMSLWTANQIDRIKQDLSIAGDAKDSEEKMPLPLSHARRQALVARL